MSIAIESRCLIDDNTVYDVVMDEVQMFDVSYSWGAC